MGLNLLMVEFRILNYADNLRLRKSFEDRSPKMKKTVYPLIGACFP